MRVKKHNAFCFVPSGMILANTVYAFAMESDTAFAVLQSRVHEAWARLLSSTLGETLNYSSSDCFDTFPFPRPDPSTALPELEASGHEVHAARAAYLVETQQGLTKAYNALKDAASGDPHVLELRRLHEAMDRAVLDAYGWTDLAVPPYCPKNDADRAALQTFDDEVIDRLYVLNAERAREEARLGVAPTKSARAGAGDADSGDDGAPVKKTRGTKTAKKSTKDQGKLFDT
jgi:hypothetical protein